MAVADRWPLAWHENRHFEYPYKHEARSSKSLATSRDARRPISHGRKFGHRCWRFEPVSRTVHQELCPFLYPLMRCANGRKRVEASSTIFRRYSGLRGPNRSQFMANRTRADCIDTCLDGFSVSRSCTRVPRQSHRRDRVTAKVATFPFAAPEIFSLACSVASPERSNELAFGAEVEFTYRRSHSLRVPSKQRHIGGL